MRIGVPKEIKTEEYRVAMTPAGVRTLHADGHQVFVEANAGLGSGFVDSEYLAAGALVPPTPAEVYAASELIVKVKEPLPSELALLTPNHVVFGYFHFASSLALTESFRQTRAAAVAYETLEGRDGSLPLLIPMSEIAGRLSIQAGAKHLERPLGGRGTLLGGVPGVAPGKVVVLGGGVVGTQAALMAAGLGADVAILDVNLPRLRQLAEFVPRNVHTIYSDVFTVEQHVREADLVIGAVLLRGRKAPRLVSRELVSQMLPGSVIVDVCIDQGGCVETAHATTHAHPTYTVDEVVHYCVTNMPGAVSRTSTAALCNATLPYVRQLAGLGLQTFLDQSPGHRKALNIRDGEFENEDVQSVFQEYD
jgi:alanine dehydrogenase